MMTSSLTSSTACAAPTGSLVALRRALPPDFSAYRNDNIGGSESSRCTRTLPPVPVSLRSKDSVRRSMFINRPAPPLPWEADIRRHSTGVLLDGPYSPSTPYEDDPTTATMTSRNFVWDAPNSLVVVESPRAAAASKRSPVSPTPSEVLYSDVYPSEGVKRRVFFPVSATREGAATTTTAITTTTTTTKIEEVDSEESSSAPSDLENTCSSSAELRIRGGLRKSSHNDDADDDDDEERANNVEKANNDDDNDDDDADDVVADDDDNDRATDITISENVLYE